MYWEAKALSAEGQVEEALYGNAVGTTRTYDPETGLVTSIQSGLGDTSDVQDLGYAFDSFGNLDTREDFLQDVYESFTYDTLHRLTGATVYDGTTDTQLVSKSYSYDAIGNIVNKSDVGAADYVYGTGNAAGAGDAGPHAVVSAGGATYAYDDNGNLTSGDGRALTWTSFNKPASVATTSTTSTFVYGPERARIQQTQVQGATTTTIKYVGAVFEQLTRTGEATQYVHYLFAGGRRIAVYTEDDAATPAQTLRYVHTDHLGSVDTLTDESGAVVERLSYDAWGKRRVASGVSAWRDPVVPIAGAETRRGFTGHEHLDEFALIHMNGRVYDPSLGRFLSADPFIQFPASTQGLNRYSYVRNNPLRATDPDGYTELFGDMSDKGWGDMAGVGDYGGSGADVSGYDGVGTRTRDGGIMMFDPTTLAAANPANKPGYFSSYFNGVNNTDWSGLFGSRRALESLQAHGLVATAAPANATLNQIAKAAANTLLYGGRRFAHNVLTNSFRDYNFQVTRYARDVVVVRYVDLAKEYHFYGIYGAICSGDCSKALADEVYGYVNNNDIPFTDDDLGSGRRNLETIFGIQPINHRELPEIRTNTNFTVKGHMFHLGDVTHHVEFSYDTISYDIVGTGTGAYSNLNVGIGINHFGPDADRVVDRYAR